MLPFALCMASFGYSALIELAVFSRWSALTAVLFTVLVGAGRISRGKAILCPSTAFLSLVSFWLFLYAITARGGLIHGITGIVPNLLNWNYAAGDSLIIALNICQGPYVMAEAIRGGSCVYDPAYVNLSFSVLPSFIDGWRSVVDQYQRINWFTPFNAFAELYFFGWPYQVFFLFVYAICVRVLTKAMLERGTVLGMLIVSPSFFSFFAFHQYAVRMSFRLLVYSAAMSWIVSKVMAYRQRVAPRARVQIRDRATGIIPGTEHPPGIISSNHSVGVRARASPASNSPGESLTGPEASVMNRLPGT
jgi:hypothetical protein